MEKKLYEALLYIISIFWFPFQIITLLIRALLKKEDLKRIIERLAITSEKKKDNLIWIHAVSVGEINLAFLIVDLISQKHSRLNFLITSSTLTSAKLANNRINKINKSSGEKRIIHQLIPIDNIFVANIFMNYWKPRVGIFIESELWPCISFIGHKYCPLLIFNARMSDRSFARWKNLSFLIKNISSKFSTILTQSKRDFDIFNKLGFKNNILAGNLKYIQKNYEIDDKFLYFLEKNLSSKIIILAASTHANEEELVLKAFRNLKLKYPNIFLILAPRHPDRAENIADIINKYNFKFVKRSSEDDITNESSVYLLDTIGELETVFSLKPITIMGGSFSIGGHNILEPARFESPIIFGPDMANFIEIRNEFIINNAAIEVLSNDDLERAIEDVINMKKIDLNKMVTSASKIIKSKEKISEKYTAVIEKYI